ncbi:excisionase family DNA-binding protein [Mycobacterium sp.]|uniref:excisionase family DNA-binding protein n=1 Tax=Mycobacterium sp. TaxID=1785 RepID=UPI003F99A499
MALAAVATVDPAANRARRRSQAKEPIADSVPGLKPAITIQRIVKTYDIPYSTVRQWIREGRLPAYRVANGRQVRVYVKDFEKLFIRIGGDD